MMINQTSIKTPLTPDAINALNDDDLMTLHRLMTRAALAYLHDQTTPCCPNYIDRLEPIEPHGLHSDDGNDYLIASIDIAAELMNNDPLMRSDHDDFRNWLTNKIDPNADDSILNYASDGIAPIIYDLLWSDEIEQTMNDGVDTYIAIANELKGN